MRRTINFSEEEFDRSLDLFEKQRWLRARREEFKVLLSECKSADERLLIIELLSETILIDIKRYFSLFEELRAYFEESLGYSAFDSIFVSSNSADRVSSSHEALYQMRNAGWRSEAPASNFLVEFAGAVKKLKVKKHLVLVDDFIGSGKTILKALNWFDKEFEAKDINPTVTVLSISGCREGIERIQAAGRTCFCAVTVPKGISDRWAEPELTEKKQIMETLEARLQSRSAEKAFEKYRFGWGRQEAVFVRERGRTPNNVFPIFWWSYVSGKSRQTVMERP